MHGISGAELCACLVSWGGRVGGASLVAAADKHATETQREHRRQRERPRPEGQKQKNKRSTRAGAHVVHYTAPSLVGIAFLHETAAFQGPTAKPLSCMWRAPAGGDRLHYCSCVVSGSGNGARSCSKTAVLHSGNSQHPARGHICLAAGWGRKRQYA